MNNKTIFFNVIVALIANFCSGMEDLRLHPDNKIIRQLPVGAIYLCKNQIFMCNQSDGSAWIENLKTNDKVKIDGLDKFVHYEVNPKREKMVFWNIQKVVLYDVIRKEKCILDLPMDHFEMIAAVCFSGEENLVIFSSIRTKDRFTIYNYKHSISSIQEHNNLWDVLLHLTEPFIYCLSHSRKLSAYKYKQMINSFEIQYLFDKDLQGDTFSPSLIGKGFLATSKNSVISVININNDEEVFKKNNKNESLVSRFFYPKGLILVTVSEPKIKAENKTYIRYWDFLSDTLIDQTILKGSFTSGVYFSANGKKIILPYRTKETRDKFNFKKFHDSIMCLVPLSVRYEFLRDKWLCLFTFINHYKQTEQWVPEKIVTFLVRLLYKKIR